METHIELTQRSGADGAMMMRLKLADSDMPYFYSTIGLSWQWCISKEGSEELGEETQGKFSVKRGSEILRICQQNQPVGGFSASYEVQEVSKDKVISWEEYHPTFHTR